VLSGECPLRGVGRRVYKINKTGSVFDKTGLVLRKTETSYRSKTVFGRFLQFIDRFLSVLKTGTILVFESMVKRRGSGKIELNHF
jgi:hypothetical protein